MESLKKLRTPLRSGFTNIANSLEKGLEDKVLDVNNIEILMAKLDAKWIDLNSQEKGIHELLLADDKCSQQDFNLEYETFETYSERYIQLKIRVKNVMNSNNANRTNVQNEMAPKRKYKLPKIEFKKFNGDVKEWLGFWGQFKKIHEDQDIAPEDKLQYLSQSTVEGSRARDLVDSFPPSAENYEQVIECMKARFGREDLLIEVYVRELLNLILTNSMNQNEVTRLTSLYDKIEAHLRALETLGVTSDKYASMLYPLVESCLPEDTIRLWERNIGLMNETNKTNKLTALMSFLKSEVEGEERIAIAKEGFGLEPKRKYKYSYPTPINNDKQLPTAVGLFDANGSIRIKPTVCSFCERSHDSAACKNALKMSLDDKKKILTKKGCFSCMKSGRRARDCRSRVKCEKCNGKHHAVMCNEGELKEYKAKISAPEKRISQNVTNDTALGNRSCSREILLQTYVKLRNKNKRKTIRAIIDTGSQRSYLSKRMVKEMEYDLIEEENIVHNLFGGEEHSEKHFRYRIFLTSISGEYNCNFEVLDQQKICSDIPIPKLGTCTAELYDKDITITDQLISKNDQSSEIDLLIGSDVGGKLLNGNVIHLPSGLVAVGTYLGWTLMGKVPYRNADDNSTMIVTNLLVNDSTITELWRLDVIGIIDPATKKDREERDFQTKLKFENSISLNNEGRYEVALPWAEDHIPLPTNKDLALKRLESTTNKIQSLELYTRYDEVFKNWNALGIISEVGKSEITDYGHYLPHRPVVKENSSTPVRPVFDASAKAKYSPSLNQCLECGPNLIELIPSILLRFREGRFAAIADIEKAFLQISVRPADRDYLRFFWWSHEKELKIFHHARVVFGVKSSPFILASVIKFHLKKHMKNSPYDNQLLDKLLHSFYVDNVVASFDSKSEMMRFIEESQMVMYEGKFNLRGWLHTRDNSQEEVFTPVLGLLWNRQKDTLALNMDWLESYELIKLTKRIILTVTQKVFDPVGFISPVLIRPKIILQNLWKTGISWDAEVDENTKKTFLNWYKDLSLLKGLSIPRWIGTDRDSRKFYSIHTFCDASNNAYAATVFLRTQTFSTTEVHLLASKSRVAPIKPISIPRLELLAATVGARLCKSVLEGLRWQDVELYFWSDSTTVLTWIQKEENWTVFVANRVREIRNLTNPNAWRHVSGTDNPADLPSRGCSVKQLLAIRWWEGPPWLKGNENEWPTTDLVYNQEVIAQEMRKCCVMNTNITIETEKMFHRISSYVKLVRVIAWIYRFYFNAKSKSLRCAENLTRKEMIHAEHVMLKAVQKDAFPDGIKEQRIKSLLPVLDERGLLRVDSRIFRRKDKKNFRLPILLPSKHRIVHMLILSKHNELGHPGVQILMNHLREKYWILQSRRTIRQVISSCIRCKRYTATHPETKVVTLPEDRVNDDTIFEVIGVDLAGPLYLKNGIKAWIVLFTCAVYRAVHIELITSLTAEAFLQSLRRFIARRGRPTVIYSDNGSNFVKAHSVLSKLNWQKIESQTTSKEITWKFIPAAAPWWGGWWERLIGMIKQILRRVLGQALLNYEELNTVLCDTESLINSRPLTYLSEDVNDLTALSPLMFLQETKESGVPDIDKVDAVYVRKRYFYIQKVREDLRKRFRLEYLGQLQHAKKSTDVSKSIAVGEIVLIGSDNLKRLLWPIGRIVEVLPGKDGIVRVVKLQTKSGIITRPVQRVYPLELSNDVEGPFLRSKAPNQMSTKDKDSKDFGSAEEIPSKPTVVVTRSGRVVKPVQRTDL